MRRIAMRATNDMKASCDQSYSLQLHVYVLQEYRFDAFDYKGNADPNAGAQVRSEGTNMLDTTASIPPKFFLTTSKNFTS